MKKTSYILLLTSLCIILFVQSCRDPIDVGNGNENSQLVLEAMICAEESTSEAHLSTSIVINSENQQFEFPEDAILSIKKENGSTEHLFTYDNTSQSYKAAGLDIEEGQAYEISASWPNTEYLDIYATTTVPLQTKIEDIVELKNETVENVDDPNKFKRQFEFLVEVSEPAEYPAFFRLDIARRDWIIDEETGNQFLASDELIHFDDYTLIVGGNAVHELEHIEGILIDASKLTNNTFSIAFETEDDLEFGVDLLDHLLFTFQTLDKEFYNYHITTSRQIKAAGTSFNQPISSYSNVNNGFGYFGSMTESLDSISVQ